MATIAHVLCPVDFSEYSFRALERAVQVAAACNAKLTVLHVLPPIPSVLPSADVVMYPPFVYTDNDLGQARAELASFLARCGADSRAAALVTEGPVVAEILDYAEALDADLIVIGTHGRSGFERLMLGSVAERIVAKAPCPVLTVPGRTAAGAPVHTGPFTRVLCAIDFSPASLAALAHVRVLGAADGRVTLLHVVEPAPMLEPAAMSSPGALEYLQVTANIVRARLHERAVPELGRRGEIDEMVRSGKPYSEILRAAEQVKADLIVMGAHGGLRGLIAFGSTATHVVRQASCPVLTIKG